MNILCRCGTTIESNKKKSVKMKYNKYTAIDFFCGGGGMTCGLRQAGIDVIAGVDFDKEAKYTYEINNPGSIFVEANIRELEEEYFEKDYQFKEMMTILFWLDVVLANFIVLLTHQERNPKLPRIYCLNSKDLLSIIIQDMYSLKMFQEL